MTKICLQLQQLISSTIKVNLAVSSNHVVKEVTMGCDKLKPSKYYIIDIHLYDIAVKNILYYVVSSIRAFGGACQGLYLHNNEYS